MVEHGHPTLAGRKQGVESQGQGMLLSSMALVTCCSNHVHVLVTALQ